MIHQDSDELADRKNNNLIDGGGVNNKISRETDGGLSPPGGSLGPLTCDHEHFPVLVVDEVFNIAVDDMFNHLFTDSKVFQVFVQQRNTYDVRLADWTDSTEAEAIKVRTIYYTLSINYSIGPKSSPSTEIQRMLPGTKAGLLYVIDADCMNGGVPYADSFYTTVRYCITKVGPNSTRLHISGKVVYRKKMLGLIKNFIEKTAHTGLKSSFGVMADLLRLEAEGRGPSHGYRPNQVNGNQSSSAKLGQGDDVANETGERSGSDSKRQQRRQRRRLQHQKSVGGVGDSQYPYLDHAGAGTSHTDWEFKTTDVLTIFLLLMVLFLLCFHIILYNQLSTLELIVHNIQYHHQQYQNS